MFWEQIETQYKVAAAHQFLLHFNVQDLLHDEVYGYLPTLDYLMEQLNRLGCQLVLGYNSTQGFAWPHVGKWLETQKILGLIPKDQQAPEETRERRRINAQLAVNKIHEDGFYKSDPVPTKELIQKMHDLLKVNRVRIGLVINYLEQIAPNDPSMNLPAKDELKLFFHQLQNWAADLEIRRRKHIVLLITQNTHDIHPNLLVNQEMPLVEIPFPDYDERLKFIEHLDAIPQEISMADSPGRVTQVNLNFGNTQEKQALAHNTAGLNLFGIHDMARHAASYGQKVGGEILRTYRRESVKTFSHGIIEMNEPLANRQQHWSAHVTRVIQDIAEGMEQEDRRRIPRGILFLGPTGNGNVYAASLLAGQTNMALVRLRYANQVSEVTININENSNSYERNLIAAINFIKGIAPVVVFMEEIEQASPHTSIQAESWERAFPVSLTNAISDTSLHGKVIWVGTSSRPDLMPPIFRKPEIFSHKLVFLAPMQESRAGILQFFCRMHTREQINFQEIARNPKMEGLSVSDIAQIAQRGHNIAKRNNRAAMTQADLLEVVEDFMPDYSPEMQLFMGLLALHEANSRAMLPEVLPPQYQEFVAEAQIDKTKVKERLMVLSRELGLSA